MKVYDGFASGGVLEYAAVRWVPRPRCRARGEIGDEAKVGSRVREDLELAAIFEGTGHGDFVGILYVGAGGDACGDAGNLETAKGGV